MVHKVLDEEQVFRIDHFLGKEATQNLHVLRFANGLFDAVWCAEHVRAVQIDVPEKLGITDRAEFYDATGAVLDMLVTHLFQVAAEIAMEPPASLAADDLQAAREEVIGCFRPLDPDEVVLGQFDGFTDVAGGARRTRAPTPTSRPGCGSTTTGGATCRSCCAPASGSHASEQRVSLILREPDGRSTTLPKDGNVLSFDLSGNGAIDLELVAKRPGPAADPRRRRHRRDARDPATTPTRCRPTCGCIHDVLVGDRSLFTRPDGLAAVWEAAGPLLDNPPKPQPLRAGLVGPGGGARARRARRLAAGPVTRAPHPHDVWETGRRAALDHRGRVARPCAGRRARRPARRRRGHHRRRRRRARPSPPRATGAARG